MNSGSTSTEWACKPTRQRRDLRGERGDFCFYLDNQGAQHFNFAQRIWLHPSVDMAVTPVMTVALETLAINVLSRLSCERDYQAAVGATSRRVVRLAPLFCAECLLTARADGWVMPCASLRAWLATHDPLRERRRR